MFQNRKKISYTTFPENALVVKQEPLKVSLLGYHVMRVPQNVWAVLCLPSGRLKRFGAGTHDLNIFPGQYELWHVDNRRHSSTLPIVRALTQDVLNVSMSTEIIWKVCLPEKIIGVHQPLELLETTCQGVINDFIRSLPHDKLVATSPEITANDKVALTGDNIAENLKDQLRKHAAFEGFEVLDVIVANVEGDSERLAEIKRANIRKTEIEQSTSLQELENQQAIEALMQQLDLAMQQESLTIKNAEIDRLEAEERDRVRLQKANVDAKIAKKMWSARHQEVILKLLAENPQRIHEQILKSYKVRGKAFEALTEFLLKSQVMPVSQRSGLSEGFNSLAHALDGLVHSMGDNPENLLLAEANQVQEPSLVECLAKELEPALELPSVEKGWLQPNGNGCVNVSISIPNYQITIECDADYKELGPRNVEILNGKRLKGKLSKSKWNGQICLRDIFLQVAYQIMADSIEYDRVDTNQ